VPRGPALAGGRALLGLAGAGQDTGLDRHWTTGWTTGPSIVPGLPGVRNSHKKKKASSIFSH